MRALQLRVAAARSEGAKACSSPAAPCKQKLRVRAVRWPDPQGTVPAVSQIFAEAFAVQTRSSDSRNGGQAAGGGQAAISGVLGAPRTQRDWQLQVEEALEAKQAAAAESRLQRLERQSLLMRAQLARLNGQPARVPPFSQAELQQIERWRRQRSFVLLVAQDPATGEMVGGAAVSLAQPEAALPPPFPTAKPRRAYISNMAVLPQHRRRGVATALLRRCERMARLWRRDSLWLHVDLRNQAAMQLYQGLGYAEVGRDPVFSPTRRCLMRKEVPGCTSSGGSSSIGSGSCPAGTAGAGTSLNGRSSSGGGNSDSRQQSGGIFDWSQAKEPEEAADQGGSRHET